MGMKNTVHTTATSSAGAQHPHQHQHQRHGNLENRHQDEKTLSVNLELKGINAKDWITFWAIPRMTEQQKIEFLSAMINGGLQEILYNNPKLLMDYAHEPS